MILPIPLLTGARPLVRDKKNGEFRQKAQRTYSFSNSWTGRGSRSRAMAMKRGEAAFTGCFNHVSRPWYRWDNGHDDRSMSLARGWAILMEFLAFLGVLLIIGCPIVLLVLQFSILGRQREMMDLLTGLMGDVRRELREGRRDRGKAGEPMARPEAPVSPRPPLWWSIPSGQARPRSGGVAPGRTRAGGGFCPRGSGRRARRRRESCW